MAKAKINIKEEAEIKKLKNKNIKAEEIAKIKFGVQPWFSSTLRLYVVTPDGPDDWRRCCFDQTCACVRIHMKRNSFRPNVFFGSEVVSL